MGLKNLIGNNKKLCKLFLMVQFQNLKNVQIKKIYSFEKNFNNWLNFNKEKVLLNNLKFVKVYNLLINFHKKLKLLI